MRCAGCGVSTGCTWGPGARVGFDEVPFPTPGPHVLSYRATLDVLIDTVARVSGWIQAHRRRVDVRPWQRAATCWTQAVLVMRWLIDGTDVDVLARDARISQATAYRYLDEAL